MKRMFLAAALAISAAACVPAATTPDAATGTPPVDAVGNSATAVERAAVAFDRAYEAWLLIRVAVDRVTPYLSEARAARVSLIRVKVDALFERARLARDLAEKAAILSEATAEAAKLRGVTAPAN